MHPGQILVSVRDCLNLEKTLPGPVLNGLTNLEKLLCASKASQLSAKTIEGWLHHALRERQGRCIRGNTEGEAAWQGPAGGAALVRLKQSMALQGEDCDDGLWSSSGLFRPEVPALPGHCGSVDCGPHAHHPLPPGPLRCCALCHQSYQLQGGRLLIFPPAAILLQSLYVTADLT